MLRTHILSSVTDLPIEWDDFLKHDLLLQRTYLKALEEASPENIDLYFILVYRDETLLGAALVQHVKMYLQDIFRKNSGNTATRLFRNILSSFVKGNILVVGNLTHTGQHGVYFDPQLIEAQEFVENIFNGLSKISIKIKGAYGKTVRLYLFKDYFTDNPLISDIEQLENKGLYRVKVQPNMILKLKHNWQTLDDYYLDLNKKYKRRFRTAQKKLSNVFEVELSQEDIINRAKELTQLYRNVSDNAKLNMFLLPENHFQIFKEKLKDDFKVYGFFLNDELIGFYTLLINRNNLETYFLGYSRDHQFNKQLYLNMLYNMLRIGIDNKFDHVVYARTAMEIKSSIGAEPLEMEMYIKHTNRLVNRFMKPIFSLLDPTTSWQERHPFK